MFCYGCLDIPEKHWFPRIPSIHCFSDIGDEPANSTEREKLLRENFGGKCDECNFT